METMFRKQGQAQSKPNRLPNFTAIHKWALTINCIVSTMIYFAQWEDRQRWERAKSVGGTKPPCMTA